MRKFNYLCLVLLMALSACVYRTPTPAVDPYHGTPPPAAVATETEDPLHIPVQPPAPAAESRSLANGIRCDVDGNNKCDLNDVTVVLQDIRATTNAPKPTTTAQASGTARPTLAPTATRAATAQATATTRPTGTPLPTATSTPLPTATSVPPSEAACLNCVDPKLVMQPPNPAPDMHSQPCPVWAHDVWLVTGPNGKLYRTWHPPVQPEGLPGAGCNYDHSHGTQRDPRQSNADHTLPAYGYDADLAGMSEPHQGFKTEWANKGDCNADEGFCSTSDVKVTVHMGTAGAGRLIVRDHTFIFDMVGYQGSIVHVRGMADTGDVHTQCDSDKFQCEPAPDTCCESGFRMIAMPQDQALARGIFSPYEVWQFHLTVGDNIIISKFANFDGITVGRKMPDGTYKLEPTANTWPNAPFSGCRHDVYFGGFTLNSNVDAPDIHGVRQFIHIGSDGGHVVLDTVGKNTYKRPFDGCGPVPYAVN